jgi:hypothetical protein
VGVEYTPQDRRAAGAATGTVAVCGATEPALDRLEIDVNKGAPQPLEPATPQLRDRSVPVAWGLGLATVGAGVLLGALDFVWIRFVPFPLGELGNSSAVWAVAAFLFAYWLRRGWAAGMLGGVVLLVVAVPSYYLTAAAFHRQDPAGWWSPTWTGFAVLAGAVFGAAGTAARRPDRWQIPALTAPAAVLLAEAGLLAARLGNPSYEADDLVARALVEAGLGILLVVLARTTWRRRSGALLLAAPFAAVGFGLFRVAGFV